MKIFCQVLDFLVSKAKWGTTFHRMWIHGIQILCFGWFLGFSRQVKSSRAPRLGWMEFHHILFCLSSILHCHSFQMHWWDRRWNDSWSSMRRCIPILPSSMRTCAWGLRTVWVRNGRNCCKRGQKPRASGLPKSDPGKSLENNSMRISASWPTKWRKHPQTERCNILVISCSCRPIIMGPILSKLLLVVKGWQTSLIFRNSSHNSSKIKSSVPTCLPNHFLGCQPQIDAKIIIGA